VAENASPFCSLLPRAVSSRVDRLLSNWEVDIFQPFGCASRGSNFTSLYTGSLTPLRLLPEVTVLRTSRSASSICVSCGSGFRLNPVCVSLLKSAETSL